MTFLLIISGWFIFFLIIWLITRYCHNPFYYPYKVVYIDITGKKKSSISKEFDRFIINMGLDSYVWLEKQEKLVKKWKKESQNLINAEKLFRGHRKEQFQRCIDDEHMFVFIFTKETTRYRQRNYQRTPYKVQTTVQELRISPKKLREHIDKLEEIDFAAPLEEYYAKNQRSLMTEKLKRQIKERDNYTCQMCGKYMPDEVGLHVDHIVPVSRGGKSVPNNLQVLCDKCNLKKGTKKVDFR